MKLIRTLSVVSILLLVIALFLPYSKFFDGDHPVEVIGFQKFISLFQLIFTAFIFAISSIFRNKITAVIAFSLCFGFSIYFIFLSYALVPTYLPYDLMFSYGTGFYLAACAAFLCWLTHLFNVIHQYRKTTNNTLEQ